MTETVSLLYGIGRYQKRGGVLTFSHCFDAFGRVEMLLAFVALGIHFLLGGDMREDSWRVVE